MTTSGDIFRIGRLGVGRFPAFVATSGASALVNLLIRHQLSRVMLFEAAVAIAYAVSTALAFALARWLVFKPGRSRWQGELGRFVLVNVFGFLQVIAISAFLLRVGFEAAGMTWHPEELAHFLALASLAVTSYHAHGRFSFAKSDTAVATDARA